MSIYYWIALYLLAPLTASLEMFYQYTIQPGEIFGRFGLWLNYHWIKSWRRPDRWKRYLLKPLICQYCNGVYLSGVVYYCTIWVDPVNNAGVLQKTIGLFLFIGLNYIFTKLLSKIT